MMLSKIGCDSYMAAAVSLSVTLCRIVIIMKLYCFFFPKKKKKQLFYIAFQGSFIFSTLLLFASEQLNSSLCFVSIAFFKASDNIDSIPMFQHTAVLTYHQKNFTNNHVERVERIYNATGDGTKTIYFLTLKYLMLINYHHAFQRSDSTSFSLCSQAKVPASVITKCCILPFQCGQFLKKCLQKGFCLVFQIFSFHPFSFPSFLILTVCVCNQPTSSLLQKLSLLLMGPRGKQSISVPGRKHRIYSNNAFMAAA